LNKRQRALTSYNKALAIFQANFGENHPLVALCYSSMANHYERRKYYSTSLEMRQKALQIAEKTLPPMHPNLALYHLRLSQLLIDLRHRNLEAALHHANASLDIANRVFLSNHPQLLQSYLMLSEIYSLMKDFQQSIFWFNKVEAFDGVQSTNIRMQKVLQRRKTFICNRCHRIVWIYRCFEWMKNTRLNCFVFHVIHFFFLDRKRYYCNY
jgi:tetratricopeptide (TPR) repeat protein